MAEEVTIKINARDAASGKLREVIGLLDQSEGEVRDLDRATRKGSTSSQDFGKSMFKATLGAQAVMEGAKIAARAIQALGKELIKIVTDTAEFGDNAAKTAQQIGVSVEAMQEFNHVATISGANQKSIEAGFRRLGRAANDAAAGKAEYKEAFDQLNISAKDANGTLKSIPDLTEEVADRFANMTNETEKVALAQDLFGRSGTKLIPMLNQGSAGIQELRKEANDLGIVMGGQAAADAEAYQDSMTRLTSVFKGAKLSIGSGLIPVVTALMDAFRAAIGPINLNTESIRNMAFNAVDKAMGSFVRLIQALDDLSPIITGVITYAKILAQSWKVNFNIIQAVGKTIMGVLVKALSGALGAIEALVGGAQKMAQALDLDMAKSLQNAQKSLGGFRAEMDRFADASFDSAAEDVDDIGDALGNVQQALADAPGIDEDMSAQLQGLLRKVQTAREEVAKARLDTPSAAPRGGGSGGGGDPAPAPDAGPAKDTTDEEIKRLDAAAELEAKMAGREIIARKELQAARATDEVMQARLQHEARLLQLSQQDLTTSELKLQQLKSEKQMREEIAKATEESTDAGVEGMRAFADAASKSGAKVAGDIGNIVDVFADIEKGKASAADALGAVGQAAGSFAEELGASAAVQAGIMAIFETAMGFATLWTNPAESAGHFIAAANFGIVAGKKAAKSKGSGGGAPGGGGGQGADVRQSTDQAAEASSRQLVEALSQAQQLEGKSMTIINDFSGATLLESQPATQNRISEAAERGAQRMVRAGGRG